MYISYLSIYSHTYTDTHTNTYIAHLNRYSHTQTYKHPHHIPKSTHTHNHMYICMYMCVKYIYMYLYLSYTLIHTRTYIHCNTQYTYTHTYREYPYSLPLLIHSPLSHTFIQIQTLVGYSNPQAHMNTNFFIHSFPMIYSSHVHIYPPYTQTYSKFRHSPHT